MKEASGELSMTAIAVVAIAAIGVVFTTLIWPGIRATIQRNTDCAQTIACEVSVDGRTQQCTVCADADCNSTREVTCPNSDR